MENLIPIAFYLFAAIIIISAALVVFARNIMTAAFSLLFTLFGVAAFYVLLNADFLAITQIMVYIGGILVLIIFGVMLTTKITGTDIKEGLNGKMQVGLGGLGAGIMAIMLSILYCKVDWYTKAAATQDVTINAIGKLLLTDYLLAFESASVLLLVAIIGAALIARRRKDLVS